MTLQEQPLNNIVRGFGYRPTLHTLKKKARYVIAPLHGVNITSRIYLLSLNERIRTWNVSKESHRSELIVNAVLRRLICCWEIPLEFWLKIHVS